MSEISERTGGLDLGDLRLNYARAGLREADCETNPVRQFEKWFREAQVADLHEPNAMVLSTVDAAGQPSGRVVLLKHVDDLGFVFYTNYLSRKAQDVKTNPRVAATFFWGELERQVRVEGTVGFVSRKESEVYFRRRPRGSRIGAWVSSQSQLLTGREELEATLKNIEVRFEGVDDIPVPEHWGGYRISPLEIEFWQGRTNRLHDRIRYRRQEDDSWVMDRLWP